MQIFVAYHFVHRSMVIVAHRNCWKNQIERKTLTLTNQFDLFQLLLEINGVCCKACPHFSGLQFEYFGAILEASLVELNIQKNTIAFMRNQLKINQFRMYFRFDN